MRKILILFFLYVIGINQHLNAQLNTGLREIVPGNIYVLHSQLSKLGALDNTSNIYIINGASDTVWIFGTGYGDKSNLPSDTSDFVKYRGADFDPTRNAINDAIDVDSIITQNFGLPRDSVRLQFIVPHFHLDHINKEFVAAFFDSLSYSIAASNIFVHVNDSTGAKCNSECCGTPGCPEAFEFFGAPFQPAWTPTYLNLFRTIGNISDSCNQIVKSFTSGSGLWTITKANNKGDGGHTNGTINLQNSTLLYRIMGGAGTQCYLPNNWMSFPIHGDIPIITTLNQSINDGLALYPNPSLGLLNITVPEYMNGGTYYISNQLGMLLLTGTLTVNRNTIDLQMLESGIYSVQVVFNKYRTITDKFVLIK